MKFSGSLQNGKGCREQDTVLAQPAELPRVEMQDKDDLPSLGAAIAAGVEVLVTGDQELLDLGHIEDLEILSPRQFWKKLRVQPIRTETT
jgi:predicted nucleic acid-binding protein